MLLGDAVAITQLLRNYCLICQLYLTEMCWWRSQPSDTLNKLGGPLSNPRTSPQFKSI